MPPRKDAPASASAGPSKRARVEELGSSAVGAGGQGYDEEDLEEVKVRPSQNSCVKEGACWM